MSPRTLPCALLLSVVCCAMLGTAQAAGTRTGRLGILVDVHGYMTPKGVLVPLRGIAEWLGATVEYKPPVVTVQLGERSVALTLGAETVEVDGRRVKLSVPARVIGNMTCVPVRFVAEALGCDVQYISRSDQTEATGHIRHVRVRAANREAVILVHAASPDVVAGIVASAEAAGSVERMGFDYVLGVTKTAGDWAKAHQPSWRDDHGFAQHWRTGFYRRSGGAWKRVALSSRVSYALEDLDMLGIPLSVAKSLGMEICPPFPGQR